MISLDELRDILTAEDMPGALPAGLGADDELALDSLQIVWLSHALQSRHGLRVEFDDGDAVACTSLTRIRDVLAAKTGDSARAG